MARSWQPVHPLTIFDAIEDPSIWGSGQWFRDPETWQPWFTVLKVLFGLPLDYLELQLFRKCTGRQEPPPNGTREAWFVVGRKGGKSRVLALIAVFLAVYRDWSDYLSPGEVGTIKIIATDRRPARVIHRYTKAFLTLVPALAHLVERDTDDEIILNSGITRGADGEFPVSQGLHHHRVPLRRDSLLAQRGQRQPGSRNSRGRPPRYDHRSHVHAVVRIQPLRSSWRALGTLPPVLWPRRCQTASLASRHSYDEPDGTRG